MVGDPASEAELALITAAAPLIQTRISQLTEAPGMLGFLFADEELSRWTPRTAKRALSPDAVPVLQAAEAALAEVQPWTAEAIQAALTAALVEPAGLGLKPRVAFAPVRVAVTGRRVSPPLYESIELLGPGADAGPAGPRDQGVRLAPGRPERRAGARNRRKPAGPSWSEEACRLSPCWGTRTRT